jgi:SPP1 gp7 family putative phage head morphogenesis protein
MRVLYQLLEYQRVGIEEVRYVTKGDNKVRSDHAKMNGRIFKVADLLRPENENKRIPLSDSPYNCRCKYEPYMRGFD